MLIYYTIANAASLYTEPDSSFLKHLTWPLCVYVYFASGGNYAFL